MSNQSPFSQVRGQSQASSIIVAIGGGKGGVGKSFISTNLAIFLANMGFNTTLYDLDFGAPNLHTCLGMPLPTKTFHDYINGKIETLGEAAVSTKVPKLKLISGSNDHTDLANITLDQQSRLMSAIYRQKTDFTILDLSAGTHTSTLDFFLMAERHIITLTPDPTSIENAYRFMKAAFFRKVKRYERQLSLDSLVMDLMNEAEKNDIKYPSDLMKAISLKDPVRGQQLREKMSALDFQIVLNQTRSLKDVQLGKSIESVCKRYFGLPTEFLGAIEYDNAVWHALRKRNPLLLEYPHSPLYAQILAIARDLASPHIKKAVI